LFLLSKWFQKRRFLWEFPIGSHVKLSSAVVAILVEVLKCRTPFNLLLRNHWANCNQTLVEWSLDGPLSKLCPVFPTSNQDGRQAKNRKNGWWNLKKNLLLWNYWANLNQTFLKWSLDGPLPKLCPVFPTSNQDGRQAKNSKKGDEIKKKLTISSKFCSYWANGFRQEDFYGNFP
jgi:hypothetical protein